MGPPKFQPKVLGRPVAASASGFSGRRPAVSPVLQRVINPGGTSARPAFNVAAPRPHWPPPFVPGATRSPQPVTSNKPFSSKIQAKPAPQLSPVRTAVSNPRMPQFAAGLSMPAVTQPRSPTAPAIHGGNRFAPVANFVQYGRNQTRPSAGIVQRMRGADLAAASTKALDMVGVKAATEVQAMHVDGSAAMTANEPTALDALDDEGRLEDLVKTLSPSHARRLGAVKWAEDYPSCATKLAVKDRSLIILNKGAGEYHAEQRLLLVLAQMLKNNSVPDTIHVWGAKPPCGTCKAVLKAFSDALDAVYEKVIIFSNQAGQDRVLASIKNDAVFTVGDSDESKFAKFARKFRENLN